MLGAITRDVDVNRILAVDVKGWQGRSIPLENLLQQPETASPQIMVEIFGELSLSTLHHSSSGLRCPFWVDTGYKTTATIRTEHGTVVQN